MELQNWGRWRNEAAGIIHVAHWQCDQSDIFFIKICAEGVKNMVTLLRVLRVKKLGNEERKDQIMGFPFEVAYSMSAAQGVGMQLIYSAN